MQINHTANLTGALMTWHKKKNVTLVTDNGREDGKSCSLDHTLFFLLLDLRVTFAIQAMPMVIKIIKVHFITSTPTCKKPQPELYLNVQFPLMFHILLSLRPFILLFEADQHPSVLQANSSLNEVNIPVSVCCAE